MKVENTENNRKIQQVAATMAIEDMYMSKDCLQGLIDVANGTKQGVTEELKATDMMRWIGLMNIDTANQQRAAPVLSDPTAANRVITHLCA